MEGGSKGNISSTHSHIVQASFKPNLQTSNLPYILENKMAASTKMFAICIIMMLVSSFVVTPASAESLGYGAIGADAGEKCTDGKCETLGDPANNYNRGCEADKMCRGG